MDLSLRRERHRFQDHEGSEDDGIKFHAEFKWQDRRHRNSPFARAFCLAQLGNFRAPKNRAAFDRQSKFFIEGNNERGPLPNLRRQPDLGLHRREKYLYGWVDTHHFPDDFGEIAFVLGTAVNENQSVLPQEANPYSRRWSAKLGHFAISINEDYGAGTFPAPMQGGIISRWRHPFVGEDPPLS